MDACYCDIEPADVYKEKRPIARVQHTCSECGKPIYKGERYELVDMVYDGTWIHCKTCVYCLAVRDLMVSRLTCFCWAHKGLWEEVYQTLSDLAPGEVPGLSMEVGRLIIERRRDRSLRNNSR